MAPKMSDDDRTLRNWITEGEFNGYLESAQAAQQRLSSGTGAGSDFLGWQFLPQTIPQSLVSSVVEKAQEIRAQADVLVCIGIGGSYLGAKAAIEALSPSFDDMRKPRV